MPRVSSNPHPRGRGEPPSRQDAAGTGAEGLLAAAAEHPQVAAGLLSAAQDLGNPSEFLKTVEAQTQGIHSVDDAFDAASNVANKLASTTAGQQMIEQAAKAKKLYDEQTSGRITKAADYALRAAQSKLTERATGPGVRLPPSPPLPSPTPTPTLPYLTALRLCTRQPTHTLALVPS